MKTPFSRRCTGDVSLQLPAIRAAAIGLSVSPAGPPRSAHAHRCCLGFACGQEQAVAQERRAAPRTRSADILQIPYTPRPFLGRILPLPQCVLRFPGRKKQLACCQWSNLNCNPRGLRVDHAFRQAFQARHISLIQGIQRFSVSQPNIVFLLWPCHLRSSQRKRLKTSAPLRIERLP